MKIIVPEISGFCYGVSLAIKGAQKIINDGKKLLMYGEIVHNPRVVADFISLGARVIETVGDITEEDRKKNAEILIRAHGVSSLVYRELESTGLHITDCTCPKVKKVHNIVMRESEEGRKIVIIGNPNHPEVKGILGWCKNGGDILADYPSVVDYNFEGSYSVVVQTTFNIMEFERITHELERRGGDVRIFNTICPATDIRQKQIEELSKESDFVVVVGGKNSSNSKKLLSVASLHCEGVLIEEPEELELSLLASKERVLVCAGSSTPKELVNMVVDRIRNAFFGEVEYK